LPFSVESSGEIHWCDTLTVKNPSYLVKSRHGIWYFQIQIPKKLQKNGKKRKLFRKSLKTAYRKSALSQARHWWVLMEKNNYEWEQEQAQESADLYSHGKYIYGKLNELDPHDSNELDEFFLELSEFFNTHRNSPTYTHIN
jgi:hypothetical protein